MDHFPAPTDLPAPYRRREECPHLARTAKIVALALVYFGGAGIRVRKLFPGGSQAASVRVVAGEATRSRSRPGGVLSPQPSGKDIVHQRPPMRLRGVVQRRPFARDGWRPAKNSDPHTCVTDRWPRMASPQRFSATTRAE
jgi:hypothetical protein